MQFGPRTLVFGVILAVMPAASWYLMYKPTGETLVQLQEEAKRKRQEIERADQRLGESGTREETRKLKEALDLFKHRLPDANEMPKIIDEVCDIAKKHGLTVKTFKNVATINKDSYGEQTIRWTLVGTFKPNLMEFLAELETLPRIMRLSEMKLEGDDKYTGAVTADFTLTTFFTPQTGNASKSVAVAK
jgi:Tfp pilus assembly protein PilO